MSDGQRLHSLDAVRALALLLGVVFHGAFSFIPGIFPGIWATVDNSPSQTVSTVLFVAHMFRMTLFFFMAGFFAHLLFHRKGVRGFWADRLKRIAGPMLVGWIILFPTISAVWVWGITRYFHGHPPPLPANLPHPWGAFPLTHLWFLYFLLILYIVMLAPRSVIVRLDGAGAFRKFGDNIVSMLVRTNLAALVLSLPLSAMLYWSGPWVMWFGIPTPDHSVIPDPTALVGFGTPFVLGWLAHRQIDLLQTWARRWPLHLAVAILASLYCLAVAGTAPKLAPAPHVPGTLFYAMAYCLGIWCWAFAITGVAVRFLSDESPARRYVADSSYWIYLIHLPVVAVFQVLVAQLPLHWSIKLVTVLGGSFAVLFASYHFLVRYTWIGAILNGRKQRHAVKQAVRQPA